MLTVSDSGKAHLLAVLPDRAHDVQRQRQGPATVLDWNDGCGALPYGAEK